MNERRRNHSAAATPFVSRVLAAVRAIPAGRVATYGDVAALAGRPGAARAVGHVMRECHRPDVPCHRVISAGGRLGGYGGQESLKRAMLMAEGIPFSGSRIRALDQVLVRAARLDPAPASTRGGARRRNATSRRAPARRH